MSKWEVKEDDFGYWQWFQIYYSDGTTVFDLTGYTAVLQVWSGTGSSRVIKASMNGTLDAAPSTGRVRFTAIAADFNTAGEYSFHVKLTTAGSEVKTDTYTVRVIEGAA